MKHICLKTGTRILSGILSMSMMAGILSMPVMANETDTYKPVNNLKFTSNIKMAVLPPTIQFRKVNLPQMRMYLLHRIL